LFFIIFSVNKIIKRKGSKLGYDKQHEGKIEGKRTQTQGNTNEEQRGHEGENQSKHRRLRKQATRTSEDKKKQGRVSG
jgi:hypothetical protein